MNYIAEVLEELRSTYGVEDKGALEFARRAILQSFRNGLQRGKKERGSAGQAGQQRERTNKR